MTENVSRHAPTCPVCTSREQVQREHGKWLCGACWTVFTGSQEEWEHSRHMRETRAALFKNLAPAEASD